MGIQTPTKLRRNALCPCGSGRKFKKCCGKVEGETIMDEQTKIATTHSLKNEIRKEVRDPYAGIPEAELVRRDQAVLLREQRFRIDSYRADHRHITEAIEKGKAMRIELLGLPKSLGRESALKELDVQIKTNEQQLEKYEVPRKVLVNVLALEELLSETEEIREDGDEAPELADE